MSARRLDVAQEAAQEVFLRMHRYLARFDGSRELAKRLSIHLDTLRRMVREGRFPLPRRITDGISGWPESQVDA